MEEWGRQRRGGVYVKRLVTGPSMTAMTAGQSGLGMGWLAVLGLMGYIGVLGGRVRDEQGRAGQGRANGAV